jgi:hypothetical protein
VALGAALAEALSALSAWEVVSIDDSEIDGEYYDIV